jgi:Tfp pilus assembly protein PilN
MKAVNLIPADERRSGGRAGIGSYILLGVLALIVAMSAAYALVNRNINDRRAELESVQAQAQVVRTQAQQLAAYTTFTAVRQARTDTVRSLAGSRFDWSHALHEIARTIPSNAWLTSMRGTVTPGVSVDGGSSDPLRASVQSPAIEILGCTVSHDNVATVISALRRVDGVQRVSLSSSQRLDDSSTGSSDTTTSAAGSGQDGDCRQGNQRFAQFSMTLFFATPNGPDAPGTTTP